MKSVDNISKQHQRNWAWIWFAYTGFLFVQPLMEPSLLLWLGTLAVFSIFIAIFFGYVRANDQDEIIRMTGSTGGRIVLGRAVRFWIIAATFTLGLITFPWNQGASTFFIYAACFLPFSIESVRRVLWLFLLECLIILAEGYLFTFNVPHGFFHIGWPNTFSAIFLVVIIGTGNIFFAKQKRAECKLRLAQEENFALAAVAERERIARDLHDILGHTLSVIVLKAELARRLIEPDPQRATQEIADVERTARTALAEVREAIGGYRSRGLIAELEQARNTLSSAGVVLACDSPVPQLNAAEETVLSLALREAVTNIVRHAHASSCTLRFSVTPDGYHALLVQDDGPHPVQKEGNGLRGMRERVQSLGGRFSIDNLRGTTLLIELPPTLTANQQHPAL